MRYSKYLNEHIPPFDINLENGGDESGYIDLFYRDYVEFFTPYMIRRLKQFGKNFGDCNILDIGCGGGPLAGAVLLYKDTNGGSGIYTGLDIRGDLIDWLQESYKKYDFVEFKKVIADTTVDYIEANKNALQTVANSDGKEADIDVQSNFYDFQWSSSVFTHLTPESCVNMLRNIVRASKKDGIHMNTWLVVDDESRYALQAGIADRNLPFDMGEFLTYSKPNPLLCTAYKEEHMFSYYEKAGLEIIAIEKGSWRGPIYQNDALHYQDIVISRVK